MSEGISNKECRFLIFEVSGFHNYMTAQQHKLYEYMTAQQHKLCDSGQKVSYLQNKFTLE